MQSGEQNSAPQQQPQQQQQQRNDQNGGDLHPLIVQLVPALPAGAGEMPIDNVLAELKERQPDVFSNLARLAEAAKGRTRLSDAEAGQWKERGNGEYSRGDLQGAVATYTQGLACAESDEVVATLLNNRSTVFMKLNRVADACLDAHKAFGLKPDYWKALQRRGAALAALGFADLGAKDTAAAAAECAGDANDQAAMEKLFGDVGVGLAALALPPRATLCANVAVERAAKGRGLVAGARLDAGPVLEESPYALVARAESLLSVCSYCLQFTGCLYPGEAFRAARVKSRGFFCSRGCAAAAWRWYGERECTNAFFYCCPNDALLAWRLVQSAAAFPALTEAVGFPADFDPISGNNFGGAQHIRTLEGSHSKELSAGAAVGGYESVVACVALYMGAVASPAEAEQLRKAQRQILLNAFDVTCVLRLSSSSSPSPSTAMDRNVIATNTTARVGKGIYSVAALLNHGCDPNCVVSFLNNPQGSSPRLVVRAIRPVMEGEELTVAYGGIDVFHFHSMRHRLQTLRERYGFICRCHACVNQVDEAVRGDATDRYTMAADYYQKGRRMIREGQCETAVTVLLQSYEIVMRYICPPPNKPQMMVPKTHDALALAYFHLGNRAKCVEHLKAALETDVEVHGGNANRLELVNEYTRLAFLVEAEEERRGYAEKAVELLRRFYAPSSTLELQIAYTESAYKK